MMDDLLSKNSVAEITEQQMDYMADSLEGYLEFILECADTYRIQSRQEREKFNEAVKRTKELIEKLRKGKRKVFNSEYFDDE